MATTERFNEYANGRPTYDWTCYIDIVTETAMGVTVKAQTEKNSRYVSSAKR